MSKSSERHPLLWTNMMPGRSCLSLLMSGVAWHEHGSGPDARYQQNTLLDAEVSALTLNIFHRHTDRVRMANISEMVNTIQSIILTDKERMLLTPTYHIFDMFSHSKARYLIRRLCRAHYDFGGHSLRRWMFRGTSKDGKLYLALVQSGPASVANCSNQFDRTVHGRILTGPALDTHNTFEAPEPSIPCHSPDPVTAPKLSVRIAAKVGRGRRSGVNLRWADQPYTTANLLRTRRLGFFFLCFRPRQTPGQCLPIRVT